MDIKCPECNTVSSDEAWDEATQGVYGEDSERIVEAIKNPNPQEELWWACPACGEPDIETEDLKVVDEDEDILLYEDYDGDCLEEDDGDED